MKKLFKLICISIVFIMSFTLISGCGCDKPLNVKFQININDNKNGNVQVRTKIIKKFREPGNTPCYEKIEDEYVLIENAGSISACYDKNGNAFEKATYANTDKLELDNLAATFEEGVYSNNTSYEVPKDEKHSLIFEFQVHNKTAETINLQEIALEDILNQQLKGESIEKITFKVSTLNIVVVDNVDCYSIEADDSITFTIEMKGLKNSDTQNGIKEFNLNLPLIIK